MTSEPRVDLQLAMKLGGIAIHAEEWIETGEPLDLEALKALLSDEEVQQWLNKMSDLALVPLKREAPQ